MLCLPLSHTDLLLWKQQQKRKAVSLRIVCTFNCCRLAGYCVASAVLCCAVCAEFTMYDNLMNIFHAFCILKKWPIQSNIDFYRGKNKRDLCDVCIGLMSRLNQEIPSIYIWHPMQSILSEPIVCTWISFTPKNIL